MKDAIQLVALAGAIGCFIVFLVVSLKQIPKAQKDTADRSHVGWADHRRLMRRC